MAEWRHRHIYRNYDGPVIERERDITGDSVSTDLASRRTAVAFQRTRMAADRSLMAVIRTSLSLISFGFTISQMFERLAEKNLLLNPNGGHRFGLALVLLGIVMLVLGIAYHLEFMLGLRRQHRDMRQTQLIREERRYPASLTLIVAVLLLLLGVSAAASMMFRIGPFY